MKIEARKVEGITDQEEVTIGTRERCRGKRKTH